MSDGRRYRVVKRFRWPEGGNPTAEGGREGGESVTYEPGDTVHMEDQDLELGMHRYLDALDDAGRAVLEEARAKAKASLRCIASADLSSSDVELLNRASDEKRRLYGCEIVQDIGVQRDGSEVVLSTRYVPANPRPDVIYGDDGLPDTWATARQRKRQEKEREQRELESKAEHERSRARRNARANSRRTKVRNEAIAAFAVRLAKSDGDLADNPSQLAAYLLERWKPEWGLPVQPSTLRRILKEQHVASTLRRR